MMAENDFYAKLAQTQFPDPMDLRIAALYLNVSEARMRTLLREGTVKSDKVDGKWSIKRADLDTYKNDKGTAPRKSGGTRGDGKAWIIHVKFQDLQKVKDALTPLGIQLEPRYDYAKQKEYQAKRKAAQAAEKKAAPATAAPATPANVNAPRK
jgi:hypothetical protein